MSTSKPQDRRSWHDGLALTSEKALMVRTYVEAALMGDLSTHPPDVHEHSVWHSIVTTLSLDEYDGDVEMIERDLRDVATRFRPLAHLLAVIYNQPVETFTTPHPSEGPPELEDEVGADGVRVVKRTTTYWDEAMPALPAGLSFPPELTAGVFPTLDLFAEYNRQASPEGYEHFHTFAALWVISVIAARRVSLVMQRKHFYTNLMFVLVANTSMFAKSTTVAAAMEVLREAGLSYLLGPNRTTPQKLLSDMAGLSVPPNYDELSPEQREYVLFKLKTSGQRGLYMDEFGKFVQGMVKRNSVTADFADLLLTLDACPPEYEYATLNRGVEMILQPYMPVLGCATPTNLKSLASRGADLWGDGFWGRFSFITAPPDQYRQAPLGSEELPIPMELVSKLKVWHERLGLPDTWISMKRGEDGLATGKYMVVRNWPLSEKRCTISQEAHQAWGDYRMALRRMLISFPHTDFHGSYVRLPETAMRIALLIASLENCNHVGLPQWARAQELTEILRANMHEFYIQANADDPSESAIMEERIMSKIKELHGQGRSTVTVSRLSIYLKKYSAEELLHKVESLVRVGVLEKIFTPHAKQGSYRIPG